MKAIVTVVLTELPWRQPKTIGMDVLGRLSTDMNSKHKSLLIINSEPLPLQKIESKILKDLKENKLKGRVSRIEILEG